ncbi:uncharacterized protein MONOS_10206 [Monocercomonoides exilis]|uniref:uncharacterized protein n=1 Tax=Monocercomonoides exilis TaxID=2049356 RepID=UPI0035599055|nr:hypothetical protein MONOS_10206 [Monocercomonoides exilis]|eukprot:MONOS_10206.1-p1 / transcript=MONOS_10206.1 / gene=MONOS_10206 / organism=Monocercomonoides_exilis_PA203 / gene_product=unspecified product / transcript_product=unspecified product / location=Mono_scaffold00454:6187-7450(-) / protein_length=238 / sequence_SO=supercontig / SO=protein_coding / is_pseudo=false
MTDERNGEEEETEEDVDDVDDTDKVVLVVFTEVDDDDDESSEGKERGLFSDVLNEAEAEEKWLTDADDESTLEFQRVGTEDGCKGTRGRGEGLIGDMRCISFNGEQERLGLVEDLRLLIVVVVVVNVSTNCHCKCCFVCHQMEEVVEGQSQKIPHPTPPSSQEWEETKKKKKKMTMMTVVVAIKKKAKCYIGIIELSSRENAEEKKEGWLRFVEEISLDEMSVKQALMEQKEVEPKK